MAALNDASHILTYLDLRATSEVFEEAVATNLVGVGLEAQQTLGEVVSTNYFSVLGIRPAPGTDFGSAQDKAAIISHHLWQRAYFPSDSQIAGKQIRLNGELFTIIGVAPKQFSGTFAGAQD